MHEMMAEQADSSVGPVERLIELRDDVANQIRVSAAAAGAMPVDQVDIGVDHFDRRRLGRPVDRKRGEPKPGKLGYQPVIDSIPWRHQDWQGTLLMQVSE